MALQTIDKGLQEAGELFIWYKIFTSAIAFLLFATISVLVGIYVRRGWASSERKIEHIDCKTVKEEECETVNHKTTCHEEYEKRCTIRLHQVDKEFIRNYRENSTPPSTGEDVTVYYDPKKEDETMTLTSFPKTLIVTVTALLAVGNLVWLVFLYKERNNQMAKRIAGAAAVGDIARTVA